VTISLVVLETKVLAMSALEFVSDCLVLGLETESLGLGRQGLETRSWCCFGLDSHGLVQYG